MKVKSIRGSIKYNGIVYDEGEEFDISSADFGAVQENVEVVSSDKQVATIDKLEENNTGENEDTQNAVPAIEENPAYSKMKKDELISIAKEKGIDFTDKTTKDELVSLLENFGK